ncbi:TetR family transcriptional regulator [Jannaschia pagri]|uniref:TetR family transcriptional regulator n=2 Tax=Roseobacteraceae TaxID=2854170 RepID=A0ABQ4NGA5_9RHOB|nr:TetR family transcriptional regulator [Jannaschia sp. AI_61]GIT93455.1 TetR family transcriptional regulator [Jannaschia sp. AI_62]
MKDLERALDMRPGSFYAAFGSKEALFALALERYAEDGAAVLAELVETHGPLDALIAHLRGLAACPPGQGKACMAVKTLLEVGGRGGVLATRSDALLSQMEARFAALFAAAQASGDIDASYDPDRLARRYQSDVTGLRAASERAGVDAVALAEDMVADLERLRRPQAN